MEEYHTFNVGVASSNLVTSTKVIFNGSDKVPKALDITGQKFGKLLAIKKLIQKMEKPIGYVNAIAVNIKRFKPVI